MDSLEIHHRIADIVNFSIPLDISYVNGSTPALEIISLLGKALVFAIILVAHLVDRISRITWKLIVYAFPYAKSIANDIIKLHAENLTRREIAIEISVIIGLLLVLWYRKRIRASWKVMEDKIAHKSKLLARMSLHIIFFLLAAALAVYEHKLVSKFTSPKVMPIFSVTIPAVIIMWRFGLMNDRQSDLVIKKFLELWIFFGCYHGTATLLSFVPFSSFVVARLPYIREFFLIIIIWAQIHSGFVTLLLESLQPFLNFIDSKIPTASTLEGNAKILLASLKFMNLLSAQQETFLLSLIRDIISTILAFVMMFLPYPFSDVGLAVLMFYLPVLRTSHILQKIALSSSPSSLNNSHGKHQTNEHHRHHQHLPIQQSERDTAIVWLRYWIFVGVWLLMKIYGKLPWTWVSVLLFLWLQHAVFQGSHQVFVIVEDVIAQIKERERMNPVMTTSSLSPDTTTLSQSMENLNTVPEITSGSSAHLSSSSLSASSNAAATEEEEEEALKAKAYERKEKLVEEKSLPSLATSAALDASSNEIESKEL